MTFNTAANLTNYTGMFAYANSVTSDWFMPLVLIALSIVLFLSTIKFGIQKSLVVTGFISFIASMFLRTLGLIPDFWIYICGVALMFGVLWIYWKPEN